MRSDFKSEFFKAKLLYAFLNYISKKCPSIFHVVTVNTQGLLRMLNQCTPFVLLPRLYSELMRLPTHTQYKF